MITAEDLKTALDALPLKKRSTTSEILMLLACIVGLMVAGIFVGLWAKNYFDSKHNDIIAAITAVDTDYAAKVQLLNAQTADNTRGITSLRTYYWSNGDMQQWASKLDRANRQAGAALIVPEVPPPPAGPH